MEMKSETSFFKITGDDCVRLDCPGSEEETDTRSSIVTDRMMQCDFNRTSGYSIDTLVDRLLARLDNRVDDTDTEFQDSFVVQVRQ